MLDFNEELKNFKPSLEVEDIEQDVQNNTISDLTQILDLIAKNSQKKE